MRRLSLVVLGLAAFVLTSSALANTAQLEVTRRAAEMIRVKIDDSEPAIKRRVAALYRVTRAKRAQNLLTPVSSKRAVLASNLHWVLERELAVLFALRHELEHVEAEGREITSVERPLVAPGVDLLRPVANAKQIVGFGLRKAGKVRLSSRGVTWSTRQGDAVVAPLAGTIVFSGRTRGGELVVIEQGTTWVVISPVSDAPSIGAVLARGQPIGTAASTKLSLELRISDERGGTPVDPGQFSSL